ncbi:MAG: hypothetical protein NVS3B26_22050 [Mycobacteriales bacterium]
MVAILSPGQGSQTAGMLLPWLELPDAPEILARWSALVDVDLLAAGPPNTA